jgi:Holliday junction resolvase RusA-like endonuclease
MTQRDRWAKRPAVQRYFAFRDEVRLHGVVIPDRVRIIFVMPMPASWSAKKRAEMDGQPHTVRPDGDNLAKGIFDSVFENDAHIWEVHYTKIWGVEAAIEIGEID